MKKAAGKIKPQVTIVSVAVTTAGPVTMKAVREWVESELSYFVGDYLAGNRVNRVTVKRDANIERPRR